MEVDPAQRYAAAIMAAIKDAAEGAIERQAASEALMTVGAMLLIAGDDSWTDDEALLLGESYGSGMTKTLLAMLSLRAKGATLPFDDLDVQP